MGIPLEAAEAYEAYEAIFVPNMFARWPSPPARPCQCGRRRPGAGRRLRHRHRRSDRSRPGRSRGERDRQQGDVAALPFPDESFDAVLCQMGLMFFPDPVGALREMARVATAVGSVVVVVPADIDEQPAEGPLMDVAMRYAGPQARALLGTYFSCGTRVDVEGLMSAAGLRVTRALTATEPISYESVDAYLTAEVESTPFARPHRRCDV